ncbi:MAG: P1 family peptidase [Clostridia bacterium]|nr:P1 family peptidase [Clostridia bacterium]MBQ4637488.1 P1 family peptidase [Clostridia bacterium]
MNELYNGSVCDINGILVGHEQNFDAMTGVTCVLCPNGATGGVAVRGAAPGTRETDLLNPENTVDKLHGVTLCGGSAYGLEAASGVMRWLEEKGYGLEMNVCKVPIVSAAVIYDLGVGDAKVRPDVQMGYKAAQNASNTFLQGQVGAGTGATCGKLIPGGKAHRGGIGTASIKLPSGTIVSAIIVVNACGDVYDPKDGSVVACGNIAGQPVPVLSAMLGGMQQKDLTGQNTTIGVVVTNAKLTKAQANRLASVSHDGLALAIRPSHTIMDGDTLFAMATGEVEESNLFLLHAAAVEAVSRAVLNAVKA